MSYTPMIRQYLSIKKQYKDSILFFRLGDFYEMFFEDAVKASRLLEITLTSRKGGGNKKIPMCGIPYHASEGYIGKLIARGHKVAICEQVEDPGAAKKIVKREVVRVFTPGTLFESGLLNEKSNNYIAALASGKSGYGLAFSDVSTGQFLMTEFLDPRPLDNLIYEIERINPSEIIISNKMSLEGSLVSEIRKHTKTLSMLEDGFFDFTYAYEKIGSTSENHPMAVTAAGALLAFMEETQKRSVTHLDPPRLYFKEQFMALDAFTRRNLELTTSIKEGSGKYTLLWVLDHTRTAMGGRLLKNCIEQPLVEVRNIKLRQDAVKELVENPLLFDSLARVIGDIYDLERLTGRVVYGTANARDLLALMKSLEALPKIKMLLPGCKAEMLLQMHSNLDIMEDIKHLLQKSINDDPPIDLKNGNIIKEGYNEEVDYLRRATYESKALLAQMEAKERERTGIKSLKVGFNKVFGYYIEVTKPNLALVPTDYQRKQTLVNAERFITEELKNYEQAILNSKERLVNLEYALFCGLREMVAAEVNRIKKTATIVAWLDVILSYAEAAVKNNYVCPEVNRGGLIKIRDGRHPVIEKTLDTGMFVPNDVTIDGEENRLLLITGPNMAGKSTYMRQVSLIVLMAQIGSFVPAKSAIVGIVDRIFTRVGASDDLAGGDSTFMVEMKECKSIIDNATSNSLIIMDEVGRGTSTYDGISIARALIEYINTSIRAKTLFSTHYHELTDMDVHEGIVNYTVAVKEDNDNIIFLRKVKPGKANRSYGIHVAKLAGLPDEVLQRSNDILKELESRGSNTKNIKKEYHNSINCTNSRTIEKYTSVVNEILDCDLVNITPLQALNKMYELQNELKNKNIGRDKAPQGGGLDT